MKYSILGFNQELVMQTDLDMSDLLLLQYVKDACGVPKMKHIVVDDAVYVWLQHKKLLEDLPILRLSEGALKNRICKLKEKGFLCSKQVGEVGMRGSKTYYGLTDLTVSLIYSTNEPIRSFKSDLIPPLGHLKMTSDNLLTNDSKLDNTIPKGIVSEPDPTTKDIPSTQSTSDYESHAYSEKEEKKDELAKKKKQSLWDKCIQAIEECDETEEVKEALREYLPVRLAMKGKPLYGVNQWKGILNKLKTLKEDHLAIVRFTIEQGYASVYDYNFTARKGGMSGKPSPSVFGESDKIYSRKVSEEERRDVFANGEKF